MIMKTEHFIQLVEMIEENNKKYDLVIEDWIEHKMINNWSEKRMRWDMLWSVGREKRQAWFDAVYQYLNDDHIDTALRKIVQKK